MKNVKITSLQIRPKYQQQVPAAGSVKANPLKEIENILLGAISDTGDLVSGARSKIKQFISDDVSILSNSNFDHVGKMIIDKKKELRKVIGNLFSKDNFKDLLILLEQKYGRGQEALLNLEYDVRSLVQKYQKNHKVGNDKLKGLVSGFTKDIKIPVAKKPKLPNLPLSPQDQLMVQYAFIIIGGALVLAL